MFICENYVLCSNKDADKDVNVTDQLWELQASVVPGVHSQTVPALPGPELQPLSREPDGSVSHLRAGLAGSRLQDSPTRQALHEFLKTLKSQIHVTGDSGLGGLVCLEAFCGTNNTG